MAQVLLVRHAEKGNGKETGKKFHLSPAGQAASLALGQNLPETFTQSLKYVGGSELSRSIHAALLIAIGAGADPKVLASDKRLASEDQIFNEFGITMDSYVAALEQCDHSEVDAMRIVCTPKQYELLEDQIYEAIIEALSLDGNVILGTHSPWLQIAIEALSGKEYHANVAELDWLLIDTVENRPTIIGYNLK
ncbi:hypothetical protein HGA64_01665 [Candidatus Falkowbacteria bacterium]|nr:hypothetical protein [Candidatus Falkowbacteria bacterium]